MSDVTALFWDVGGVILPSGAVTGGQFDGHSILADAKK
jgi:hypothetical protein